MEVKSIWRYDAWDKTPALLLTSFVTFGKLLNLIVTVFSL